MDEEYELVPVNPLKKMERQIKALESQNIKEVPLKELNESIDKLDEQVMKLVTVNINLQAKITELLIKDTEQIEQVTEMIELLKRASEVETTGEKQEIKIDLSPLLNELKILTSQNEEIKKGFSDLSNFMRTDYRRNLITQAMNTPKAGSNQ